MLEDASGILWIMARNGVSRYDPDMDSFTNYDQSSGLLNWEFKLNAYFQNEDGLLYFGGTEGLDSFYPFDARLDTRPPVVVFTLINSLAEIIGSWHELKDMRNFELPPGNDSISFVFAALDFVNPNRNHFRYRLRGLDPAWSDPTPIRFLNYQHKEAECRVEEGSYRNSKR